jgi:hypothetical protein
VVLFIADDDVFEVVVDDDYVVVLFELGDEVVQMVLFYDDHQQGSFL